jgi:hypothetical protein
MIRIRRAVPTAPRSAEAPLSTVEAIADTGSEAEPSPPLLRDQIIREFNDPYLELVRLLREAAQIEHATSGTDARSNPKSPCDFCQVGTLLALQEPEHLDALEEVRIALVFFQFLEVIEVFGDYLWIEYHRHAFILPSTKRNGMPRKKGQEARMAPEIHWELIASCLYCANNTRSWPQR